MIEHNSKNNKLPNDNFSLPESHPYLNDSNDTEV